jgi:hypothetical protein
MLGATAYTIILLTSTAGLFGVGWYALLVGAIALASVSMIEHRHYRARFAAVGRGDVFRSFTISNMGTCMSAATAAFVLGRAVRFVTLG